ncbi:cytochrome c [Geobacter sp. DSM 9736]|uniref:c-type cytochrome n=1 Tax=Geobacter sp. DSM 9736 TaxID=1277350 RepID=UPI000B6044FC|nr:cytochrome c [Geobacter sp. DSM 9736]SNB46779.1 Cytochrome C oxidase, cbb3-type, subunit III [Geobacter sp. DSM 9736]
MQPTERMLLAGTLCLSIVAAAPPGKASGNEGGSGRVTSTASADGAALYQANCAACHGSLASSRKRGRTAPQIQNAINKNIGGMGYLSTLSSEQIQAIATALK